MDGRWWEIRTEPAVPKETRCFGCQRVGRDLSLIADGWLVFPVFGWVCPACQPAMRKALAEGGKDGD